MIHLRIQYSTSATQGMQISLLRNLSPFWQINIPRIFAEAFFE
jgi:hypothetical protein